MIIVGSENFVDDDYFEKEDNKKITVSFFLIIGIYYQMAYQNK